MSAPEGATFTQQLNDVAAAELGISKDAAKEHASEIEKLRWNIIDLNRDELAKYAVIPAGSMLKLPADKTYRVPRDMTLGAIAKEVLQSEDKSHRLLQLNEAAVPLPDHLPPGVKVRLPQQTWPAVAAFTVLAACLLVVGLGLVLSSDGAAPPVKKPAPTSPTDPAKLPERKKP